MLRFSAIFFALYLLCSPVAGQDAQPQSDYLREAVSRRDFDQKKWNSLREGIDYSVKPQKEKEQKARPHKPPPTDSNSSNTLKFIIITVGILLLVFLILKIAFGDDLFGPRNRKLKSGVSGINLEAIEADLESAELADPIRQAVAEGNFALAVRLHYLSVLKELSLKKRIRWKRDKTNGEYLRELAGSPLFKPVQEATSIFERVWYGNAELNREDFLLLESTFVKTVAAITAPR